MARGATEIGTASSVTADFAYSGFYNYCEELKSIEIPDTVTVIHDNAFRYYDHRLITGRLIRF